MIISNILSQIQKAVVLKQQPFVFLQLKTIFKITIAHQPILLAILI
jgi:hypothetical protein